MSSQSWWLALDRSVAGDAWVMCGSSSAGVGSDVCLHPEPYAAGPTFCRCRGSIHGSGLSVVGGYMYLCRLDGAGETSAARSSRDSVGTHETLTGRVSS